MAGLDPSIGLSALRAAQRGLEVVGHNLANATTPGYSRQVVDLRAARPEDRLGVGQVGTGVDVVAVRRAVDGLLAGRLRGADAEAGLATASSGRLSELEQLVGRTDEGGLGPLLSRFLAGAAGLAARPDDASARATFVTDLGAVARGLRSTHAALDAARADAGAEVGQAVARLNGLVEQVAALDRGIVEARTGGERPNDLLDQRDVLLRDLSRVAGVQAAERSDGGVRLTLGSVTLLAAGGRTTPLAAGTDGSGLATIVEAGTGRPVEVTTGEVAGLRQAQGRLAAARDGVDALARALISEVDRLGATGVVQGGPPGTITSSLRVQDLNRTGDPTDDPLSAAGLPLAPGGPTRIVVGVTDLATGVRTTTQVAFDPRSGSLRDLAGALDGVAGLTATAGPDGLLRVVADPGRGVDFADPASDAGGVLGALGVQPLLVGRGAADLAVAPGVLADPRAIPAGLGPGAADGRNAARLAALERAPLAGLGGRTLVDFAAGLVADAGEGARQAAGLVEATESAVAGLEGRRQATSGVSVEEEVEDLMRFERSFQAASRYLRVLDGLADDLLGIVQ